MCTKRRLAQSWASVIGLALFTAWSSVAEAQGARWVATWATSPMPASSMTTGALKEGLANKRIRQIVPVSIGGSSVRVRLTNRYGTAPAVLEDLTVGVAAQKPDGTAVAASPLTFGGRSRILIPAGANLFSDPVAVTVQPLSDVSIGFRVVSDAGTVTVGSSGVSSVVDPNESRLGGSVFLAGVDVLAAPDVAGSVLTLGDSITAGGRTSWAGVLATKLARGSAGGTMAVLNYGIGGGQLLRDSSCWGPNGVARLSDALLEPGLSAIIVFGLGGNDIRYAVLPGEPDPAQALPEYSACYGEHPALTSADLIAGLQQIVAQAHARGIRVFAAPITPYKGHVLWSPARQKLLDEVNGWMRTGGAFDGFFDAGAACADPGDSQRLGPQCDGGDKLHPSQKGAAIMAGAIDVSHLVHSR